MQNAEVIKNSKFVAMLPPAKEPWRITTFDNRVIAINPESPPLVLHEDGWKEIEFTDAEKMLIIETAKGVEKAQKTSPRNLRRLLKRAFGLKD